MQRIELIEQEHKQCFEELIQRRPFIPAEVLEEWKKNKGGKVRGEALPNDPKLSQGNKESNITVTINKANDSLASNISGESKEVKATAVAESINTMPSGIENKAIEVEVKSEQKKARGKKLKISQAL